jgi:hypothetical protein
MNEEQSVLNFFAQAENLPLALSVATLLDQLRRDMNNQFWRQLSARLAASQSDWDIALTENRDAENYLVGLNFQPKADQMLFLRPMMEQQNMGGIPRIYFGLMWSHEAAADKTQLPAVLALQTALQSRGFKHNASFLAWQWSKLYPQQPEFLSRFSTQPDPLLDEAATLLLTLLDAHHNLLKQANAALHNAPPSLAISLDGLRAKLKPASEPLA